MDLCNRKNDVGHLYSAAYAEVSARVIVVSIVSVTAERNGWTIGRTDSQRDLLHQYRVLTRDNKKLSCHREAARCLVLLSILVSHLRLL